MESMRWVSLCGLAGMLATGACADLVKAGAKAPAWSGKTIEGKAINSKQYQGKVVLLSFFSYS